MNSLRIFFAMLVAGNCLLIQAEDLLVSIDHLIKVVNDKSGCAKENWASSIDNTCICCIVKNAQSVFDGKKKATDLINECLKSNKCDSRSIKRLVGDLEQGPGVNEEAFNKQFIRYIYDRSVIIKDIHLPGALLDKHGNLTENAAKDLIVTAAKEGKLNDPVFKDPSCTITVKDMVAEKSEAPWGTLQLFAIQSACGGPGGPKANFVLKEMPANQHPESSGGEVHRLIQGATSKTLGSVIFPHKTKNLPQLVFPIAYLSYESGKKRHTLSLMATAPGIQLMSMIKSFAKNPNDPDIMRVARAYFETGRQMANFYQAFKSHDAAPGKLPKGIAHGDLHAGNIFFNPTDSQITLIDDERVANSLDNPTSCCEDIAFLLIKSLFVMKWTVKSVQNFPYKEWLELTIPSFIGGFLSAYPKAEVKNMYDALEQCLTTYKDPKTDQVWYTDKKNLGFALKDILDPIFKRLDEWTNKPFIASNIDVNARDEGGKTMLFDAVLRERLVMLPLIDAGADVNARDKHGNTPLHDAAYFGKPNAIRILAAAGADLNAEDLNGHTPLDKAIANNQKEAVDTLMKLGAKKHSKKKQEVKK